MYQAKASEEEEEEYERKRGMSALARVGKLGGKTSKLVRQASGSLAKASQAGAIKQLTVDEDKIDAQTKEHA